MLDNLADDFDAFDLVEQIVYHNSQTDAVGVVTALRRPMTYSAARQRAEFVAFDEDDVVFHLPADEVDPICELTVGDVFYDADGLRYTLLVFEPQTNQTRWHIVARRANEASLLVHLQLDETTGDLAADRAGSLDAPLATLTGGLTFDDDSAADGAVLRGLLFSETAHEVSLGAVAALDDLAPFTLALWIKPTANTANATFLSSGTHWTLANNASGLLRYFRNWSVTSGEWRLDNALTVGVWQHVAITFANAATTDDPIFYVNGVTVAFTETSAPAGVLVSDAGDTRYLGNDFTHANDADAAIDDVRIYNRILSPAEVEALYLVGTVQPA